MFSIFHALLCAFLAILNALQCSRATQSIFEMASLQVGGYTKSGLRTAVLRDLDIAAPRAKLPPRALPDDVRAKLGFGAPKADAGPVLAASTGSKAANKGPSSARPMFKN